MAAALEQRAINTIRVLSADIVEKANSGHPGAPMGMAPMAHVLFTRIMRYDPANPKWPARDRFVLSNGHASALLYSMLHLTGYDMTMDDLKQFRQVGSRTAGHPENILHPAIEVSTGPLGQGITNAVGLAIAQAHLSAQFAREGAPELLDNYTFVFCGDGCLQEGISSEAGSLAGHLGLGRLIVCYDDNHVTIDGDTTLSFTEDVLKRYEAYGWHVQHVADGDNDLAGIEAAIRVAQAVTDRPSIIKVTTTIGIGSKKQGTEEVHGSPLGKEDLRNVKTKYGFNPDETFVVPEEIRAYYLEAGRRAATAAHAWLESLARYTAAHPEAAADFQRRFDGRLPDGWESVLPRYKPTDKADATRNLSGVVLNALARVIPELMGGSADLTPSNKTALKGESDFQRTTPIGRYLRFGIREHAMAAVCNGLASYGGIIPYAGTFLNFIGYAAGAVRLSALSHFRVIYVGTHDSIGLGEDGPTHQPIEIAAMLRATPNMHFYRPADGNEVSAAYLSAMRHPHTPAIMALSRQNLPHLARSSIESALTGGYIAFDTACPDLSAEAAAAAATSGAVSGAAGAGSTATATAVPVGNPDLIVVGTGSEVSIAVDGAKRLATATGKRIQVVSMPCVEIFETQSMDYKKSVLQEGVPVMTIEALTTFGWDRYGHAAIGLSKFGHSGPYQEVYKKMGITAEAVADKGTKMLEYFAAHPVPSLRVHAPSFA